MIKKIKFALLLGNKPCRSLDDIRENFNADDIIENFDNNILLKWLKTYNLDELYNKALSIDKNSENKLNDLLDLFFEDEAKKEELKNKYKEEEERRIQEEEARKKEYEILIQEEEARKLKDIKEKEEIKIEIINRFIKELDSCNYNFIEELILNMSADEIKNNKEHQKGYKYIQEIQIIN
ncbi:hypothetical protein [Brachyspira innocens]|uniref:hypothetical protein n=1 Tax=Brachyspira innocens TaxID=13264 RepID=UPI00035C5050|nr:hypothetical protein [Brachyspira innocens]